MGYTIENKKVVIWTEKHFKAEPYINYNYVVSWHLREDFGVPTSLVNYHLSKIVKKGYLQKEATKTHTKFYLTEKAKQLKQ